MLEVRAARHGDAPALDALGAAPEAGVFVLEKNGAVIGALTLRAGEIFGCAVAPEWRGRGYGTFLLRRALRAAGPGPVYTQTPPGNAAMEALLRRCGFRPQEQALPAAGEEPARAREAGAAAGPLSLPQKWVRGAPDGDGENALAVAHAFLRTHVRPGAFALDATAGNGHDTLFLCRLVGAAGRVLAFDVQPQAVENTNARLRENGCGQVGRAVLDSHANLAAYAAPGSVDAAVFNLGYLPGGDHGVFTTPGVSVPAMRTALDTYDTEIASGTRPATAQRFHDWVEDHRSLRATGQSAARVVQEAAGRAGDSSEESAGGHEVRRASEAQRW